MPLFSSVPENHFPIMRSVSISSAKMPVEQEIIAVTATIDSITNKRFFFLIPKAYHFKEMLARISSKRIAAAVSIAFRSGQGL